MKQLGVCPPQFGSIGAHLSSSIPVPPYRRCVEIPLRIDVLDCRLVIRVVAAKLVEEGNVFVCAVLVRGPDSTVGAAWQPRNYGDRIERRFRLTRQGVRWRFQRLFNGIYVEAYEVIIFLEKQLGTSFRRDALAIAHDRFKVRQEMLKQANFTEANRYRGEDED